MVNDLARLSKAKYLMKIDAHVRVDEGFDVKMMKEMKDHYTMIPALYNLHVFDWKCLKCGNVWYQSPTPKYCYEPAESRKKNEKCDNTTDFEKVMVWQRRERRRSECYRFGTDMKFQYHRDQMRKNQGDTLIDTMSAQGSCFMLTREKYWELNICDESHGSWGQQGTEVACATWLSGGRLVTNRSTWYAHLFRTQGGDFGFPFPLSSKATNHARSYSKDLWLNNKHPKQIYPLSWLIEKFKPLPGWHIDQKKDKLDPKTMNKVIKEGEKFPQKGIIYYTDNQLNVRVAKAVQRRLEKIGLPIVSSSLKPMMFGENIHMGRKRGVLTMFVQILSALEHSESDIVFFCEHDVLYHSSHFEFTPPEKDRFYYNRNVWKLDAKTGKALHYEASQVSGIAVYRETALAHYRKRVEMVKKNGYSMKMGYEPGTHNRPERVDDLKSETWMSPFPNVDVRHDNNLSPTRWKKDQFRNQKYTRGWKEGDSDSIPGWKKNDFSLFLDR